MLGSHHQATEYFEIMFNRTKFNALPKEQQAILQYAAEAASSANEWLAMRQYSDDLQELINKDKVNVLRTPQGVFDAQIKAWDGLIATLGKDPFMKKVMDSQKAWVQQGRVLQHDERDRLQGRLQPSLPGRAEDLIESGLRDGLSATIAEGGARMRRPTCSGGIPMGPRSLADRAMTRFLLFIDSLSMWVGKAFAWLILVLTLGVSYEVFVRYVLGAPTTWAFDFSYINYGALFLMAGAYTLSRNGHVRADVLYRLWKPRTQASMDLVALHPLLPARRCWPSSMPAGTTPRCRSGSARSASSAPPACRSFRSRRWSRSPACCCCCKASPRSSAASSASARRVAAAPARRRGDRKHHHAGAAAFTREQAEPQQRVRRGPEHD